MKCIVPIVLSFLALSLPVPAAVLSADLIQIEYQEGDEAIAQRSRDVLQQALSEFGKYLPHDNQPIRVIIAKTAPEFLKYARRYKSVNVSGGAQSEKSLIAVKAPYLLSPEADYTGALRHELVHILLHRNTDPDNLPRWLNEGIAMSLANEYRWARPLHVARMDKSNRNIEYRYLDYAFQVPGDEMEFNDAYAQALSMTRFMRDRLGDETFWAVVRGTREMSFGDSLRHYTGRSPRDLWEAYRRSLWKVALLGVLVSGSFFAPAAILVVLVYFKKQRRNRAILDRWAAEEAADLPDGVEVFSWDKVTEDPDAWKQAPEEEE